MATKKQAPRVIARIVAPNVKMGAEQPRTPMCGAGSLIARGPGYPVDGKPGPLELIEAITVRTYFNEKGSGMQPVRACVWIASPRGTDAEWLSGRGSASGCGYHKESAAIAEAVSNAGIRLFGKLYGGEPVSPEDMARGIDFGGTGSSGYRDVFEAIARARGFKGPMLWVSHGL